MAGPASDLARRLGENAEAVCRHYLSNGRREGRYWLVGDVLNTPGRSLYVRLHGPERSPGAPGKWTDAATGEHGDLLDLIAANRGLTGLRDVLTEARVFLSLPKLETTRPPPAPTGSPEAARRLFAMSKPVQGTVADVYLHRRGITAPVSSRVLRFHPRCWYRRDHGEHPVRDAWPALIAAVTDLQGQITGGHRTWLDPTGRTKAPVSSTRLYDRLAGDLLAFGPDVELAPKTSNVSVRRRKQFALVQPSTRTRLDLGLILARPPAGRLEASGSFNAMFSHRVKLARPEDIDAELIGWAREAYDAAG